MRNFLILTFFLFLLLFIPTKVLAVENPTSVENNKFGIHIIDENDLDDAANLVNSSGGDYGYITFVIREDERDTSRWQKVFDKARRLHLIPIVRLATKQDGGNWTKPNSDDITSWVNFLDSLNWVVKNRYIIIGNEPNHANEWGGEVNPSEYGEFFINISKRLKISSPDYFVMMAGLDTSAPNNKAYTSEEIFIKNLLRSNPKIFDYIDGWISHSYPNPNFSAPPTDSGQKSVKGYDWEMSILKKYGVYKNIPIFVTETGWAHNTDTKNNYLDPEKLSDYYLKLFKIYQDDSRIVAFTPFVLNYNSSPFDIFSWKKSDGSFHQFYEETQKILKTKGNPIRINRGEIVIDLLPQLVKENETTYAVGIAKNTGQDIWTIGQKTQIETNNKNERIEISSPVFTDIEPGKIGIILYRKL